MKRNNVVVLLASLFLLLVVVPAGAQVNLNSTVVGTVTDASRDVIPGAHLVLRNTDTGITWQGETNGRGQYVFPNLGAGHYQITVSKKGFKQSVSSVVAVGNGVTQRFDIALQVGQVNETVNVSSAAPLIQTDTANISQSVTGAMIEDLPVQGRNFLNYSQLAPTFNSGTGDNSSAQWGLASATTSNGVKVMNAGGSENSVGYYIDGVNNNDNWVAGPVTNVDMQAVEEVKTTALDYSAQYGRDIGQISVTTKAGTNRLHGSAYDLYQNAGLNALDPYQKITDPTAGRNPYHQNQYGFTVGGPIVIPRVFNGHNRAFFFVAYEGIRNKGSRAIYGWVPTAAERKGDFSEWLQKYPGDPRYVIYNPYSFDPVTQQRTPYPNNVITNVNPLAEAYAAHFPMPNYTPSDPTLLYNWRGTGDSGLNNDHVTSRFDYTLNQANTFFFEYSRDSGQLLNAGGPIPELALGNGPVHRTNIFNAHWIHVFSPNVTNELIFSDEKGHNLSEDPKTIQNFQSVSWYQDLVKNDSIPGGGMSSFDLQQLGLTSDALYSVDIGGPFGAMNLGPAEYWYQYVPIVQFSDNVTWVKGSHTITIGGQYVYRRERDNDIIRGISFEGNYTGKGPQATDGSGWNTLAQFMTGVVSSMTQRTQSAGGDTSLWFQMPEWNAYINDQWQATSKLTLTLGLRYSLAPVASSVNDYWGVLDQSYPGWRLVMPGLTPGTKNPPFPADRKNFAPRFGFAYRATQKTVVRGGYGIFSITGGFKYMDQMFWNAPGYGGTTYDSGTYAAMNGLDPSQVYFTLDNSFPAPVELEKGSWPIPLGDKGGILYPYQDAATIDADSSVTPYLQRWNLAIERSLGPQASVSVGYVGSEGTHLTSQYDLNLPPAGVYLTQNAFNAARPLSAQYPDRFGAVNAVHQDRSNSYEALTAELKTRNWHGLTTMTGYTWSKQTDTFFGMSGESGTAAIGGQWHQDWSHAESDANHPQRLTIGYSYLLPFGTHFHGIAKAALGGWQWGGIATFESGSPLTVWNGDTSSFDYMGDVPMRTCNGNLSRGDRTFYRFFDTSCFVNPAADPVTGIADSRGDSGRNIIRGPGINNWDMSLSKSFQVGEGKTVGLRVDSFNAFNHPQWSSVDTYDDTGTNNLSQFGRVTGGRPGRNMQMELEFKF